MNNKTIIFGKNNIRKKHAASPIALFLSVAHIAPLAFSQSVNLSAQTSGHTTTLSWNYSDFSASYQEVYRDTDSDPEGRLRIATSVNGSTFDDAGLTAGTYFYWIKSRNSAGDIINSNAAQATIASNISTPIPTSSPTPDNAPTILVIEELETGYCQVDDGGAVESDHSGYLGNGYVNTENASGEGIDWSVNSNSATTAEIKWRYANGGLERPADVYVNGTKVGSIQFTSTGEWSTFSDSESISVELIAGNNSIRLQATSADGLANIDNLELSADNITAGDCSTNDNNGSDDEVLKAFPGAVGFGADTEGGRSGDVYHVTNLNNSGSGSLRDAVSSGKRTIVFEVSGTIQLESTLNIKSDYLTIAGQTAPGDGITVAGYPTNIEANHVIVRYLRFRCGDYNAQEGNGKPAKGNGNLKASNAGALDVGNSKYVVLDHVSASWSMDEVLSVTNSNNVTVQYSIIAEALNDSYHDKGAHGYGSLIRAATSGDGYTFYRNLYAHNYGRNPGPGSNQTSGNYETLQFDFVNNVIYGWGNRSGEVIDGSQGGYVHMNYVGNYAIANSDSRNASSLWDEDKTLGILTYQKDNNLDNNFNGALDGSNRGWELFPNFTSDQKRSSRWSFPEVPTLSADNAYNEVLANAGASLARDEIDTRVVRQVKNNTGKIIDSQTEVGGLPNLSSSATPQDSDRDGMPNTWEEDNGLDPNASSDRNNKNLSNIYTNLEVYLNSLVK